MADVELIRSEFATFNFYSITLSPWCLQKYYRKNKIIGPLLSVAADHSESTLHFYFFRPTKNNDLAENTESSFILGDQVKD